MAEPVKDRLFRSSQSEPARPGGVGGVEVGRRAAHLGLGAQLARGREFEPFDRSLDVQVSRLRKLVEVDPAAPRYIQTVWGVGYVFVPDGAG